MKSGKIAPAPMVLLVAGALAFADVRAAWVVGDTPDHAMALAGALVAMEVFRVTMLGFLRWLYRHKRMFTMAYLIIMPLACSIAADVALTVMAPPANSRPAYARNVPDDVWERTKGCTKMLASDERANDWCETMPDNVGHWQSMQYPTFILMILFIGQIVVTAPGVIAVVEERTKTRIGIGNV
jgi:xanthine/uracil/vitamin C permease (AzgA family)